MTDLQGEAPQWRGCPCLYTEPCDPRCTCVSGGSSRGCNRCASYGSLKQRTAAAVRLARANNAEARLRIALAALREIAAMYGVHQRYPDDPDATTIARRALEQVEGLT